MSITTWGRSNYRCRNNQGREGNAYGLLEPSNENDKGGKWLIVRWDDEEAPICVETEGMLIKYRGDARWRNP
jgi:hypothetical protein